MPLAASLGGPGFHQKLRRVMVWRQACEVDPDGRSEKEVDKEPGERTVAVPVPDAGKFPRKGERGEGYFEEELPAPQRERALLRA